MFSLFPCQWDLPIPKRFKPIKNLTVHHFPPQPVTVKISRPVTPKVKKLVANQIPSCEMLNPGEEIDVTEIDELLAEIENPSPESRAEQILNMIETVNEQTALPRLAKFALT